jgi:chorismate mutase
MKPDRIGVSEMAEHADDVQREIEQLRSRIDEIDCRIVELLNERANHALAIRDLKPKVQLGLYDPKREEEIFSHLARCNEGPLYADNLREIYEAILHVMKEL